MNSKKEDFMIDLYDFIQFLLEDDFFKEYSMKLIYDFLNEKEKSELIFKTEIDKLKEISEKFMKKYPELDDSKRKFKNKTINRDYINSFAFFDDLIAGNYQDRSVPMYPELLDDRTKSRQLLDVLLYKINKYEENEEHKHIRDFDKNLRENTYKLKELHDYNFKEWINYLRTSGGQTLIELNTIIGKINPKPKGLKKIDADWFLESFREHHYYSWISDLTYGQISQYANYQPAGLSNEQINDQIEVLKKLVTRVYENIRQNIGIRLYTQQIINRYKTRCICYDNIRDLIIKDTKFIRNRENRLLVHLTRYLFDNGISTYYKLKRGHHEIDIMDPNSNNPLIIEVKVYKDSRSKKYLLNGLYQLHSYLNNISSQLKITDGYYIIYRLGGPIYEFPEKIVTNRFTIHIVLIDVGESSESGRKQPVPKLIIEKEIFTYLKKK